MPIARLPDNFADLCRDAGLTVVEIDGWKHRFVSGTMNAVGALNHHTGGHDVIGDPADDLAYAKWMFLTGRSDLSAPIVQLALSLEGVIYIGAAGRANHGGDAKASGSVAGGNANTLYVGIEWMLSGTQPIPAAMMTAGALLNAVLLRVMDSSVQAVSCHYQTSVTGKWDIGDPNGVDYKGNKVLNVPKFRALVQVAKNSLEDRDEPERPTHRDIRLGVCHASGEYKDSTKQHVQDYDDLFALDFDHVSGTEAVDSEMRDVIRAAAKRHGYVDPKFGGDCWVTVRKRLVKTGTNVRSGYVAVMESTEGKGRHSDRGIPWLTYTSAIIPGEPTNVTYGSGHYLTDGRKPGDPNYELNRRYAEAIGDWARDKGAGRDIVLYGGDQNIVDRDDDTFFGSPMTSVWDEINHYEPTGHGNIDVIATYDRDGRVKGKAIRALDDAQFRQHSDHFVVVAGIIVRVKIKKEKP